MVQTEAAKITATDNSEQRVIVPFVANRAIAIDAHIPIDNVNT